MARLTRNQSARMRISFNLISRSLSLCVNHVLFIWNSRREDAQIMSQRIFWLANSTKQSLSTAAHLSVAENSVQVKLGSCGANAAVTFVGSTQYSLYMAMYGYL